ncbi:MAG: hypothetical protein RL380_9, partial [Verrucomicrobiota bacterium]
MKTGDEADNTLPVIEFSRRFTYRVAPKPLFA